MSIRTKIVLAIAGGVLVSALLVLTPMLIGMQNLIDRGTQKELQDFNLRFETALKDRIHSAVTMAALIASEPDVQEATATGNRDRLAELFVPGFANMKATYGIAQFQFHEPNAHSLFRVHKPSKFGDDLSGFRHTVVQANREKKPLAGLERGRAGLGIRGLSPIAYDGTHVGTVEIGLKVDEAFFKTLVGDTDTRIEFYVLPDRAITGFSEDDAEVQRAVANIEAEPLLTSREAMAAADAGLSPYERKIGDVSMAAAAFPITDFSGQITGLLHVMVPKTAYLAIAGQMRMMALGAGLVALVVGLGLAFFFGSQITSALMDLVDKMKLLTDGNLDVRFSRKLRGKGELGDLQNGMVMFRDSLAEAKRMREQAEAQHERQEHVVEILASGLRRLSAGDLAGHIDEDLGEGYNGLRDDYNETVRSLSQLITDITEAAATIAVNVGGINGAAHDLSRRTENAAATLEETAAALQDLTSSVSTTAEGAREADRIGKDAIARAKSGTDIVRETVRAMNDIDDSAEQISRIIHVIDDIAFQTNLLALNAGVEAARAGGAGSGFGVVASEVRALAQRTAEAAREIGSLISASGDKVKQGVGLVGRTGDALDGILTAVEEATSQVSRIAVLAGEQSVGLDEINTAVGQLDQVTQQNAAMFAETTTASDTLASEGQTLQELVRHFHTSGPTGAGAYRGTAAA
ncbi:Methyl-accepting chemotaxis protein I (serine chemoreceptor protein) [Rhodovulum sp. P5]|uniref:methyl-accepting chemotaxis protein n=1 Tax=Rhodovulum sp. P5 TaxID=1564506 RepID=UPI0009C2AE47|nr:methyl-accepting chemotaxis protein [Rhodovulum sp. P5]ARE38387.1 Methyl-accepting chemotaxis protein I (serine chemoreceptor protein) [Rhodovulum sp. P5]